MKTRNTKGSIGIVMGSCFVAGGLYLVLHFDEYAGEYLPDWTPRGSRIYGLLAILLGVGLICFARWPRFGARRSAVEDYVWRLSQELYRRFGAKKYYPLAEVSRIAAECRLSMRFIAYAHAMFCSPEEFDGYYGPLRSASTYDGLRGFVSDKYLDGALGFDAGTWVRLGRPPGDAETIQQHQVHDTGGG